MKVILSCIGKMKKGPHRDLLQTYEKRLKRPFALREFEVKASLPTPKRQEAEADLLLSPFPKQTFIIALDEHGKALSSQEFSTQLQDIQNQGYKALGLIIGGADGLHKTIHQRADLLMCLGRLTWPHMLVRALIVEQLYRADAILSNHPYHRD